MFPQSGLLRKGLLYERGSKYGVTSRGKAGHIGTYLGVHTKNQRDYLRKNRKHAWKVAAAGPPAAAALVYIASQAAVWFNP